MDDEFKKIQRGNRRLGIYLVFLSLLVLLAMFFFLRSPRVDTVTNNYQGKNGQNGKDGTVDYSQIYSYIDAKISNLPTPKNGQDGKDGANGINGTDGLPGADGTNGTNGSDGVDGRTPEFSCQNGNFVTRYQGDDVWQTLEANSKACKGKE